MATEADVPTPVSIDVDGRIYTEVVDMDLFEGTLLLADTTGWLAYFAPGSWGKAVRVDDPSTPDVPGGNPRNLA